MFKKVDGKIGVREFCAIVLFSLSLKATDNTPCLLIKSGESASWTIPIISGIFLLIPLLALQSLLKSNKDKGLTDIIYKLTGKYIGFVLIFSLFTIILISTILTGRTYIEILTTLFYPSTPVIVIYMVLMGASCFIATRGFENLGRSCYIALPYLFAAIVLLIISVYRLFDFNFIFPIAGPGVIDVTKSAFQYTSMLSDILILSIFFPFVRDYNKYKIGSMLGVGCSILIISFFIFCFLCVYGYPTLKILNFPFHELARASSLGKSINNLDAAFLGFWLIAVTLHFAIYLYALAALFSFTFKLNEFEPLILPFTALIIILGMMLKSGIETTFYYRDMLLKISTFLLIPLPIILLAVSKFRGGDSN